MEEALKMREEVKDDFMEWRKICEETEVILEATRIQEEARTSSFRDDAERWDETRRKNATVSDKLGNLSRSNGTKCKYLMNDWHNVLAVAVEYGWTKEVNDVASVWISTSNPQQEP